MARVTETTKRAIEGDSESAMADDRVPSGDMLAQLEETRAALALQRFEGTVTLPTADEALARAYRPLFSSASPYRLLWDVDPWSGSLFGVVLSRANTAALAALLSTPGFQWRECVVEGVVEEGAQNTHRECQCRFQIRRVSLGAEDTATDVSCATHPADCHPATWYRPASSRWVDVASHQFYVIEDEGEEMLSDEQLRVMVTSLVTLLRFAVLRPQAKSEQGVSSFPALPRVFNLDDCRVSLTDRGAATTMMLRENRWWTSVESRAATKDPTPDFGWLPRQIAREWVAAGRWQQGRDGWRATESMGLASSLLAASVWLRTKGRYAQWLVDDDTGDVRARWQALLKALTPDAVKGTAKDSAKDSSKEDTSKEEAKGGAFSLGDIFESLQKACPVADN